jgi:hypothetical protein
MECEPIKIIMDGIVGAITFLGLCAVLIFIVLKS